MSAGALRSVVTRELAIQTLRAAMPELRRDFGVVGLSLFGSTARGESRPDSDVDLLVEFDPQRTTTLMTLAGLQVRLVALLGAEVDLGTLGGLRPAFRASVEAEALRVA